MKTNGPMTAAGATPGAAPEALLDALEVLMFGAVGLTTVALARAAAGELTMAQWRVLVVVGRAGGIRVGDVAAAIGVSLPSTSRLIGRLERRGLVTSGRDPADRRAIVVRLTDRGAELRSEVVRRRRALMEEALAGAGEPVPGELTAGLEEVGRRFERFV